MYRYNWDKFVFKSSKRRKSVQITTIQSRHYCHPVQLNFPLVSHTIKIHRRFPFVSNRLLCSLVCQCSWVLIATPKNVSFRIHYRQLCQYLCSYVSLKNPFSSLPTAPRLFKNRRFLQVIGCVREYWFALLKTVFFRSVRRYVFDSFVPTALTPHPTNWALSSKWCWSVSDGWGSW